MIHTHILRDSILQVMPDAELEVKGSHDDFYVEIQSHTMSGAITRVDKQWEIFLAHWVIDQSMLQPVALESHGTWEAAVVRLTNLAAAFNILRHALTEDTVAYEEITFRLNYQIDTSLRDAKRNPNIVDLYHLPLRGVIALIARAVQHGLNLWLQNGVRDCGIVAYLEQFVELLTNFVSGKAIQQCEFEAAYEMAANYVIENDKDREFRCFADEILNSVCVGLLTGEQIVRYLNFSGHGELFELLEQAASAIRFGTLTSRTLSNVSSPELIRLCAADFLKLFDLHLGRPGEVGSSLFLSVLGNPEALKSKTGTSHISIK